MRQPRSCAYFIRKAGIHFCGIRAGDQTLPSEHRFLKSLRLELAYFSGVPWLRGRRTGGAGVILRFERVRPRRSARFQPLKSTEITPEFLDRTIRALKRWKYDIVSMDEVCRRAVTLAEPRRFVCLTFDGAYKDLITSAYPVLAKHGVPFAVYVPTAFPDGLGEAWWLALEEVIAREQRISLVMDRKEQRFDIATTSEKYQLYAFLEGWMRSLAPPDLSFAIKDLCTRYSVDLAALSRQASMDWDDLGKACRRSQLVTIGSATVNYPVLSNLKEADASREMTMGRAVAQAAFRRDVRHFAYPFGDRASFRRQHVAMAEEAGFASAASAIPGVVQTEGRTNLQALPRIAWDGRQHSLRAMRVILSGAPFRRSKRPQRRDLDLCVRPRHPADDRHRRQHPADAGHDIEDRLRQPGSRKPGHLRHRHSHQRPHHHQHEQSDGSEEFAGAYGHDGNVQLVGMARLARGEGRTIRGAQIHSSAASMTAVSSHQAPQIRAVQWWLVSIAALIALMVLVGGATRLTEAGLSIVEWKPVTGALPPLDQEQWTQAFEAYKKIPQYREMNAGMNLAEFKTIFWWEFSHRLLGRVIGIAYLLPFLWFMWRGLLGADLKRRLWLIFGLGALQGAVGWWMVASGLSQRVEVSHYPSGRPSGPGAVDLCRDRLDAAPAGGPAAACGILAAEDHQRGAGGADLRAAFSRRAGRGPARRQDLQHLAGHRRKLYSVAVAAVLR